MPGTLAIPNEFQNATVAAPPVLANLDTDFVTVRDYVNNREIDIGILANRPAAGTKGRYYLATDVQGGTMYVDDGAAWNQTGASVTQAAPTNTPTVIAAFILATL